MMRCGVEIRRQKGDRKEEEVIQCFKCREEGHQWKECPRKKKSGIDSSITRDTTKEGASILYQEKYTREWDRVF